MVSRGFGEAGLVASWSSVDPFVLRLSPLDPSSREGPRVRG